MLKEGKMSFKCFSKNFIIIMPFATEHCENNSLGASPSSRVSPGLITSMVSPGGVFSRPSHTWWATTNQERLAGCWCLEGKGFGVLDASLSPWNTFSIWKRRLLSTVRRPRWPEQAFECPDFFPGSQVLFHPRMRPLKKVKSLNLLRSLREPDLQRWRKGNA